MYESMKTSLKSWNENTTDRDKLQHAYIAVALFLLVAAGVLGLINQVLGQQILAIAIAVAGVFLVNAVAWALLQSFILFKLSNDKKEVITSVKKTTRTRKK